MNTLTKPELDFIPCLEKWKEIKGYEGLYRINTYGVVESIDRIVPFKKVFTTTVSGRIIKPTINERGYLKVGLTKNNQQKTFKVHRLVAMHFLSNEKNYPEVNHRDLDKMHNHVSNLEWVTRQQNMAHAKKNGCYNGHIFFKEKNPLKGKFGVNHPNSTLYKLLKKIDGNNIWAIAIKTALDTKSDLNQLVTELRSQAKDNPEMMKKILGQTCHSQLINL
jgi:hypothetical protein